MQAFNRNDIKQSGLLGVMECSWYRIINVVEVETDGDTQILSNY